MSVATSILVGVVWLSVVGLAALVVLQRSPKRRKPVDELEAADAALRLRINDLEDKFESYTKREAVRGMRARKDEKEAQAALPLQTREERQAEVNRRFALRRAGHGTAG